MGGLNRGSHAFTITSLAVERATRVDSGRQHPLAAGRVAGVGPGCGPSRTLAVDIGHHDLFEHVASGGDGSHRGADTPGTNDENPHDPAG
jgi:hypothetical protein